MTPRYLFHRWLLPLGLILSSFAATQITLSFPASHNIVTFSLPDKPAAMQMDILHLKIERGELTPDATARRVFARGGDWIMTSYISPAQRKLDARGFRDYSWSELKKGPFALTQIRTYEIGQMAFLEYMIDTFQGKNVHQKNAFAYMVSGDQWFEVHISKTLYETSDEKFMNSMLNSIQLIDHYQPDTQIEFGYGSVFYLKKDWARASQHYEMALEIERKKKKRSLSPTQWRVLVDNLGIAYGMDHHWEKAKTTFQFGITQDPAYPMFYYNLACAYAELNDVDNALGDLKSAFGYRQNGIPGEGMPDPAKDPSFRRLLGEARFVGLVRQVCPESRKTEGEYICQ